MDNFQLDKRLAADCIVLGYLYDVSESEVTDTVAIDKQAAASILLLMNNADFNWFVIVPMGVSVIDVDELPEAKQLQMLKEVNALSAFLKRHYPVDKINFASIGNIVNQMHFHLVARTEQDTAWPAVVWGTIATKKYSNEQIEKLKFLLEKEIDFFKLDLNV